MIETIFHLYGSSYGRNFFVVFNLQEYRNKSYNCPTRQISPSLCRHQTPSSFPRATLIASLARTSHAKSAILVSQYEG